MLKGEWNQENIMKLLAAPKTLYEGQKGEKDINILDEWLKKQEPWKESQKPEKSKEAKKEEERKKALSEKMRKYD